MESLLSYKKNDKLLEEFIDNYEWIINNFLDYANSLSSQSTVSIIDLALSSSELGPLYI